MSKCIKRRHAVPAGWVVFVDEMTGKSHNFGELAPGAAGSRIGLPGPYHLQWSEGPKRREPETPV